MLCWLQMARAGEPVDPDGSIVWVRMHDGDTDQSFFWNRRTNSTAWHAPAGVEVVWVGEMSARGSVWYWNQVTGLTLIHFLRCLLGDALRGEGLGIPS